MIPDERRKEILELLDEKGYVSVKDLSQRLYVSLPTIRRDLTLLEREGYVLRTHGGASLSISDSFVEPFALRKKTNLEAKKYIGKIELSVNAGTLNITDIENEHIEVNGKISEVTLQGNKSEIEIDSNLDMQISVLSHEGALEINQLSATSRLTIPADYRFRSTKKGIATHIYYERQGKKVDDFSDAEADNYIELNGIKSELVIVEAEV